MSLRKENLNKNQLEEEKNFFQMPSFGEFAVNKLKANKNEENKSPKHDGDRFMESPIDFNADQTQDPMIMDQYDSDCIDDE